MKQKCWFTVIRLAVLFSDTPAPEGDFVAWPVAATNIVSRKKTQKAQKENYFEN